MENSKGKPINTSVPSIAIRFNANAEEIEELYQSEEESADKSNHEKTKPIGIGDPESSPLRSYLPRIGKRSTSIDASLTTQDSSPPSDRWKFFTEIKGKITKSVEETITEIKHRNQEDSLKKSKASKDKDNSSLSESEDISESSISKTCGIVSTTEGVEMSSDDDTPSIERDKEVNKKQKCSSTSTNLKQKFKIIRRKKSPKDNSISANTLANLYELNTGVKVVNKRSRSSENVEVESGVEALEDSSLQLSDSFLSSKSKSESIVCDNKAGPSKDEILTNVLKQIKNIEVDDSSDIKIQPVTGAEIRKTYLTDTKSYTYFAPEGFVDLREYRPPLTWYDYVYSYRYIIALAAVLLFYFSITIPLYVQGFATGMILTLAVTGIYNKFCSLNTASTGLTDGPFPIPVFRSPGILEIPAVKEYQPITKFEGWMNEYPEIYNPQTYHICQTQSVYVRLQGNLLRISHTRSKIPKRAMWNESKHKLQFTEHRIYNLIGAKITLLPEGLNKRRHWSKKYPICITLNKTHENFSYLNVEQEKSEHACPEVEEPKRKRSFLHKKKVVVQMWQMNVIAYLIIRYSAILSLIIHWTCCLHYAVPMIKFSFTGEPHKLSWIVQANLKDLKSNFSRYLRSLFRACCLLFNINHGVFAPITEEDILLAIITLILGHLLSAFVIVLILQLVLSMFSAETKYQEIINQVKEYMGYKQLPLPMQRRLICYYEYRFQKSYFREDAISATLSVRLRREINLYCYRRLVDSVSIFKDIPQYVVVDIVNSLKAEIFLPNDIIVKAGTIGDCMYFLASGTVCVLTPTGKEPQIFSKLAEEDFDLESENSRHSTPSPPEASLEVSESAQINENDFDEDEEVEEILRNVFDVEDQMEDELICLDDWSTFTPEEDNPNETHIYLFGRTNREKEDWFRRFVTATHKGANVELNESNSNTSLDKSGSFSDTIIEAAKTESEYLKYMAKLEQGAKYKQNKLLVGELEQTSSVIWINALIGRVLFDCTRDEGFTNIVKDRIQRKLSSIKLPYFIEQLSISELSLGSSPPLIHKASKPVLDQRGLWVDLDITYEGVVVLVLQTKLNLMKLKQPPTTETVVEESSSAKWLSSDVDDTAESSTDDDTQFLPPTKILDETGNPVIGLGGSSNTSKKFIKMVDKIAESKFFQAATENRYIKKAMEGVSNTDLSLKVELKGLIGTLVLNMPPPPSDRLWIGFRPSPKLWLTAQPIVGERNFSFIKYLTNWIEKKLSSEFQKVLVIPNMEDILIPVMAQNLPQ